MGLCQDVFSAAFPTAERDTAQAVCMGESGGDPRAWNNNLPVEDSRGLGQINTLAWPQFDRDGLWDPAYNAAAARQVWDVQGWRAWGAYTAGTYRQFLGLAGAEPAGPLGVGQERASAGLLLLVVAMAAALLAS